MNKPLDHDAGSCTSEFRTWHSAKRLTALVIQTMVLGATALESEPSFCKWWKAFNIVRIRIRFERFNQMLIIAHGGGVMGPACEILDSLIRQFQLIPDFYQTHSSPSHIRVAKDIIIAMLSPHGCEVKRQRLYATFLDLPQDVRLSILEFCSFRDIRTNVVRVSKECWIDCWRLKRTPNTVCFTFEGMMTGPFISFLNRRHNLYEGKLTTLNIYQPHYHKRGSQPWDFKAFARFCRSATFRFRRLVVNVASRYDSPWKMGTALHLLCKGSLPNLRKISLTTCSFTNLEFCAITNNTPLVEEFSGSKICVGNSALTGEEFGNWSQLKVLRLSGKIILPKHRCLFLSSVIDRLEDVHVVGVSLALPRSKQSTNDRVQDVLYQFALAAPKLKMFASKLEANKRARLQLQRPTLVIK